MRRLALALSVTTALVLSACGSSDDTATDTTTDTTTDAAAATDPPTEVAATQTDAPADTPDSAEPTDAAVAGPIPVSLVEWAIDAPIDVPAGPVSFAVTNDGSFPHHLAIARGTSYAELPLLSNGAVDEATLGADYLGRTDNVQGGGATTFDIELEPGTYVLFCNISAGPNSHAAQGQVLSVTVS